MSSVPGERFLPEPLWSRLCEVRDVLAFSFDFELFERPLGAEAYAAPAPWLPAFLVPAANVEVFGRDLTGGVYVSCERDGESCCLHIDTRGHAVALGERVEDALAMIVALPYWQELLAQCSADEPLATAIDSMRALAERLEREAREDLPDLAAAREELQAFLELPELGDPVFQLYDWAALRAAPVTVWSPHGWRYESPLERSEMRAGL